MFARSHSSSLPYKFLHYPCKRNIKYLGVNDDTGHRSTSRLTSLTIILVGHYYAKCFQGVLVTVQQLATAAYETIFKAKI